VRIFQDLQDKMQAALNISNFILADKKALAKTVDAIQLMIPGISNQCSSIPHVGDMIQPIIDQFQHFTTNIERYSVLLESSLISANDSMNSIVSATKEVDTAVDKMQKYFVACVWVST